MVKDFLKFYNDKRISNITHSNALMRMIHESKI